MSILFKKPKEISKSFYGFFWFTIVSFIIGLVIKLIIVGYQLNQMLGSQFKHYPTSNKIELESGFGLQALIIVLTLVIYPMSLLKEVKILKMKEELTQKSYKKLKIENIIFLAIFLFLDVSGIGIIIYEKAPMEGWTLFMMISILIPAPLAAGSLLWLRNLKLNNEVK